MMALSARVAYAARGSWSDKTYRNAAQAKNTCRDANIGAVGQLIWRQKEDDGVHQDQHPDDKNVDQGVGWAPENFDLNYKLRIRVA